MKLSYKELTNKESMITNIAMAILLDLVPLYKETSFFDMANNRPHPTKQEIMPLMLGKTVDVNKVLDFMAFDQDITSADIITFCHQMPELFRIVKTDDDEQLLAIQPSIFSIPFQALRQLIKNQISKNTDFKQFYAHILNKRRQITSDDVYVGNQIMHAYLPLATKNDADETISFDILFRNYDMSNMQILNYLSSQPNVTVTFTDADTYISEHPSDDFNAYDDLDIVANITIH